MAVALNSCIKKSAACGVWPLAMRVLAKLLDRVARQEHADQVLHHDRVEAGGSALNRAELRLDLPT
eukprot:9235495-Lingulodinium_polyedra.AAC.1